VNLVVSQGEGCVYCQSAHTDGLSDEQLSDLRKGRSKNAKLNALVQLAYDITHKGGQVNAESKAAFYQQGYTDENLVDLLLQISDNNADELSAQSDINPWRFFAGIFKKVKESIWKKNGR